MSVNSFDSEDIDLCDIESSFEMNSPGAKPGMLPTNEGDGIKPVIIDPIFELSESKETSETLTVMDSLLPMVKLLLGLALEEGVSVFSPKLYHVLGSITEDVRESIYAYARQVGEIIITDNFEGKYGLSPDVILCLAQIQIPGRPLFPSLHRLRIVNGHASLDYLRLFLSPSLRIIELAKIPQDRHTSILSFLTAAVEEVLNLDTLILGGRLPRAVVDMCLRFECLQRLELVDALSSLDSTLLRRVGHLEHLETLYIDGSAASYTPSPTTIQAGLEEARRMAEKEAELAKEAELKRKWEEEEKERLEVEALVERLRAEAEAERIEAKQGKRDAKSSMRLAMEAEAKRIKNEEEAKCKLEDEAKRLALAKEKRRAARRLEEEAKRQAEAKEAKRKAKAEEAKRQVESEEKYNSQPEAEEDNRLWGKQVAKHLWGPAKEEAGKRFMEEETPYIMENGPSSTLQFLPVSSLETLSEVEASRPFVQLFKHLSSLTIRGDPAMIQDLVDDISSVSLKHMNLFLDVTYAPESSRSTILACKRFSSTVDAAVIRWRESLLDITLLTNNQMPSTLTKATVRNLARLCNLERFEVGGWNVDPSVLEDICCSVATKPSKLKILRLPDNASATGIQFDHLSQIVEACPDLVSLRCRIDHLPNVCDYPKRSSHKLEVLTIGNAQPHPSMQVPLQIARYLDLLFPNLEELVALGGPKQNAEQWEYIRDLVKMYQAARSDERSWIEGGL